MKERRPSSVEMTPMTEADVEDLVADADDDQAKVRRGKWYFAHGGRVAHFRLGSTDSAEGVCGATPGSWGNAAFIYEPRCSKCEAKLRRWRLLELANFSFFTG